MLVTGGKHRRIKHLLAYLCLHLAVIGIINITLICSEELQRTAWSRSVRGNPGVAASSAAAWWEVLDRKSISSARDSGFAVTPRISDANAKYRSWIWKYGVRKAFMAEFMSAVCSFWKERSRIHLGNWPTAADKVIFESEPDWSSQLCVQQSNKNTSSGKRTTYYQTGKENRVNVFRIVGVLLIYLLYWKEPDSAIMWCLCFVFFFLRDPVSMKIDNISSVKSRLQSIRFTWVRFVPVAG